LLKNKYLAVKRHFFFLFVADYNKNVYFCKQFETLNQDYNNEEFRLG